VIKEYQLSQQSKKKQSIIYTLEPIIMSNGDSIRALITSFQRQGFKESLEKSLTLTPPAERFAKEMRKTGFRSFKPIADLGFYEWKPDLKGHNPFDKISSDEIKRQIHAQGKPDRLTDTRKIRVPFAFAKLPPQTYENRYPLSHYEIAGLYVATKFRGLKLEDIDFVFGGSILTMLATKNESRKVYLATRIPGTSVALVVKDDNYNLNLADPGFQFERLVTGRTIGQRVEPTFTEHMQLMQVGEYKILFIAEADALKDGEPVEVISSNPYFWGIKTCLQCVCSGSPIVCLGKKYHGKEGGFRGVLESISLRSLSELYQDKAEKLKKAESEILRALDDLNQELHRSDHTRDFQIVFSKNGRLRLQPELGPSKVLPSANVVEALI
jgi:hypothetical protein